MRYILFMLIFSAALPASGNDTINLGPLFFMEKGEDGKTESVDALGPFISYDKTENETGYGLRPLFYSYSNESKDTTALDLVYPFITHRTFEGDTKFQLLVYLFYYKSDLRPSGFREKDYTLFPFVFARQAEDPERSYFALFPLFGEVKHKYGKDRISFFLFPLFLQTEKEGVTNSNLLWPFIGASSGNGVHGGRLWPVFGYRAKEDTFEETFALWPVYLSKWFDFYGERVSSRAVLPFYYAMDMPGRKQRTYAWPFINHIENDLKGYERWDAPWPFVTVARGKVNINRVWPLFSKKTEPDYESGYFLWPFYNYSSLTFDRHVKTRNTIFFFLYKDTKYVATEEGGKNARSIHLWPLLSYRKNEDNTAHFRLLSLLETFLPDNPPRERNWAPLWRIFEWTRDEDGREVSSLLWNTLRTEKTDKVFKIDLRPVIPLITYEDSETYSKFNLLGGFLGYSGSPVRKTLRFLYIPVNISSRKVTQLKSLSGGV